MEDRGRRGPQSSLASWKDPRKGGPALCPQSALCHQQPLDGRTAVQAVGRVPGWQPEPEMFLVTSGPRACGAAITAEA